MGFCSRLFLCFYQSSKWFGCENDSRFCASHLCFAIAENLMKRFASTDFDASEQKVDWATSSAHIWPNPGRTQVQTPLILGPHCRCSHSTYACPCLAPPRCMYIPAVAKLQKYSRKLFAIAPNCQKTDRYKLFAS